MSTYGIYSYALLYSVRGFQMYNISTTIHYDGVIHAVPNFGLVALFSTLVRERRWQSGRRLRQQPYLLARNFTNTNLFTSL